MAQPAVPPSSLTPARQAPPVTVAPATTSLSISPQILSADDVALYKQIMAAERNAEYSRARSLMAKVSDTSLIGYAEAQHFLSASPKSLTAEALVEWLQQYRDLSIADRIYRLAVAHSTKKVRRHHKTVIVAVVTNIPVPSGVGRRTGGY
jgi:hypothetical protein